MRNETILFLCICLLVFSSCVRSNKNEERELITSKIEKQNDVKEIASKSKIKNDIQKNNILIKDIENEINVLLKDF